MDVLAGGEIGGKTKGFIKARDVLTSEEFKTENSYEAGLIRFPASFCVGTNGYVNFIKRNGLEKLIARYRQAPNDKNYEKFKKHFLQGTFAGDFVQEISNLIDNLLYPLAVRSSSLLEDQPGTSFAGKYDTVFISNRGEKDERVSQILTAIKEVYASTFNPSAVEYRTKHNLTVDNEKMAILLQEAIGREYKGYFFPLMAGVGFSKNDYCWSKEINKDDGLVRLVFGLGTRAVGRGYARLFSPPKPLIRPEGNAVREIDKFSQATMDALDLTENEIVSFHFSKVVKNGLDCYPRSQKLFSLRDGAHLYNPVTDIWDEKHKPLLTFDPVLVKPWCDLHLPTMAEKVFKALEKHFGCPVDIEFAVRVDDDTNQAHFYMLQARPLSQREVMAPRRIPKNIPLEDQIFTAHKNVPSGIIKNIEYIVYVDSFAYDKWPINDRFQVARIVGQINRLLEGKIFILMGPGRWGSQKVDLGVPTRYSEISNCSMLVEIARSTEEYVPEVSFGTHFFQDLIEDQIIYAPLYPDEPEVVFNEAFLKKQNDLKKLLGDHYDSSYENLIYVAHIPDIANGRFARAVLNGIKEKALVYLQ
ncbi:MAG: PEP/pyruvate-binding domain-containing protein [Pseudomonadota bacterium]